MVFMKNSRQLPTKCLYYIYKIEARYTSVVLRKMPRRQERKGCIAEAMLLCLEGVWLGHCKICNGLSLMWRAIGVFEHPASVGFSEAVRPWLYFFGKSGIGYGFKEVRTSLLF